MTIDQTVRKHIRQTTSQSTIILYPKTVIARIEDMTIEHGKNNIYFDLSHSHLFLENTPSAIVTWYLHLSHEAPYDGCWGWRRPWRRQRWLGRWTPRNTELRFEQWFFLGWRTKIILFTELVHGLGTIYLRNVGNVVVFCNISNSSEQLSGIIFCRHQRILDFNIE